MSDVGTTARKLTTRDKLKIWERDKGVCQGCQRQLQSGDKWVCEHLRALELGGSNEPVNLAVYCAGCAGEKTKDDHSKAAKAKRAKAAHVGAKAEPVKKIESKGFPAKPKREPKPTLPPRAMYQ